MCACQPDSRCLPMQGAVADAHAAETAAREASAEAERQLQRIAERDEQHAEVITHGCGTSPEPQKLGSACHHAGRTTDGNTRQHLL